MALLESYRRFWGGLLPAPGRPARRAENRPVETWTNEAIEERTDEKQWNIASNQAHRAGDSADTRLRCSAQPGLRRFDQARAAQALVWAARLVAGGLRG